MAPFGYLNSHLFEALLIPEIREVVRILILGRYFPQTESQYYRQYGASPELITADELILQEPVIGYAVKKISVRIYEGFVRDQRFCRQVLDIYDYRCAMSGYSIKGVPIIEACHINRHADAGDNRIQNGIALCRNLHTAFDFGLIGLDDQYKILVKSKKYFQEY